MKRTTYPLAVFILIGLLAAGELTAQEGKVKKGDLAFASYDFPKAIGFYEQSGSSESTVSRKLADSYRFTGNTAKAEENYKKIIDAGKAEAADYYFYSEMLRSNGKYDDAAKWMDKFHEVDGSDYRGMAYTQNKGYEAKLKSEQDRFTVRLLDINTDAQEFGPAYFGNKVVFASTRTNMTPVSRIYPWNNKPYLNIYEADAKDNQLASPKQFRKDINRKYHEGPASFNADGTFMAYTRNNYDEKSSQGVRNLQIFFSTLKDGKWSDGVSFTCNSKEYSVGHPSLSADGQTLYFASDMPGGLGGTDLYRCTRSTDGSWSKPENLGAGINTEGNEMFPFIHPDGFLFFSSDGLVGLGGLDVFVTKLTDGKAGKVLNAGYPVNDRFDDFAFIIDKDMKNGYFSSNRPGKGDDDIYAVTMAKPFRFNKIIKGVTKDKRSGDILAGANVSLYDSEGKVIATAPSDAQGNFTFEADPELDYSLDGKKEKYFDAKTTASTKNMGDKDEVFATLLLEKDPGLSLYALVTDKSSKQPLEGVKMVIIDNITGKEVTSFSTTASGDFRKPLDDKHIGDRVSYQIKLDKDGYLGKSVTFNASIDKEGEIRVHEALDLTMDKITVGADLAKIININPIYFDLSKWNIRKDAAIELDKIVKVMKENPGMIIELGSHTDCRSSAQSNMILSDKRAKSSAAYIISKGIDKSRISGKGYGETKPINKCECEGTRVVPCTEEEHQQNRRTEFIIVKM